MPYKRLTFLLLLILTACNLPSGPAASTPTPDAVGTQVSMLLTAAPTYTQPAPTLPPAPTNTTAPATTATLEPTQAATIAPTEPAPTQAPPASQPTLTPTVSTTDPKSALGNPTWRNTLDSGKAFYQYENENTRVVMENGALALTGLSANGWTGWSLTYSQPARNFYLEATFIPQSCSGADMYGIVFRAPNADSGYFFGVTCDGRFNLHARDFKASTDNALIQLTSNSAILAGSNQTNRLGVMANGNKITLYANGVPLQEVTDSSYDAQGSFGALVAANDTAGFTVKMDEISLWKLP